jgi:hypothetical protein
MIHFDQPTKPNQTHLRFHLIMWGSVPLMTVSTAVITVLHSAEVVHVTHESWLSSDSRISLYWWALLHTSKVWPGNHYETVQWFHLSCNIPTEVSPPAWASHPPRSPLLCLVGSSHRNFIHTIPRFHHRSFTEHPSGLPSQLPRIAGWYAKTRLYHVLRQAIPI